MDRYKICPLCGAKNSPASFDCFSCDADLTGIKITDEETEKMIIENSVPQVETQQKLVRLCECGAKNASNARKCSSCGEDISDIIPTVDAEEDKTDMPKFTLSSLDGQYAYQIITDEVTVGRENIMSEYLAAKSYVSRSHAKITKVGNELFIENLSNTNFTYVNNQKIAEKTKLQDGDEIGLGGTNLNGKRQEYAAYFLVRIGQCM